jgi:hypothetical protein
MMDSLIAWCLVQLSIVVFIGMFLLLCSETSLYLTTNTKYEMEVDTVRGGMLQVQINLVKCVYCLMGSSGFASLAEESAMKGDDALIL